MPPKDGDSRPPVVTAVIRPRVFGPRSSPAGSVPHDPPTSGGSSAPAGATSATPKKSASPPRPQPADAESQGAPSSSGEALTPLDAHKRDRAVHFDSLTAALARVEDAFNSHDLKVAANVELVREESGDMTPDMVHTLAYMRGAEGWGFYVVSGYETGEESSQVMRLARSPRTMRVRAVDVLEDLWSAMLKASHAEDARVQRQAKRAEELAMKIAGGKVRV